MIENIWLEVRDGTRLACRLWLPEETDSAPVGVVLEALPYSKRDGTRTADTEWAEQFVPHGFAYARLDLRGSGESEGLLDDEYLAQEQQDIVDVIEQLAEQSWCNGAVGMRGYSWGGFNSLQVAMLRPPALKAIISACSSHDRYMNDAHYVGGVPGLSNFVWGAYFKSVMADAPDPAIVGTVWREQWLERVRNAPAIAARWMEHLQKDDYWRKGSISADYGAITCGVFLVGGQADAYAQSILPLLEQLKAPRKALIGPWGHHFPHHASPGPGVDWLVEEVRWWAYWLRGDETRIMYEPMLRAFVNDRTPSETWPADVPGRWVGEPSWPSSSIEERSWFLNSDGLGSHSSAPATIRIAPHQSVGIATREWLSINPAIDLPGEQSRDDGLSHVFDSDVIGEAFDLLGLGRAELRIASDRPAAKVVVRLNELYADGSSRLICYGVLNLAHREGHREALPLEPGQYYDVIVPLSYGAHRFKVGSRVRLSVSEALWPMLVSAPEPTTLSLAVGSSRLHLPIRLAHDSEVPFDLAILPPYQGIETSIPHDELAPGDTVKFEGPDEDGVLTIVRTSPIYREFLADIETTRFIGSTTRLSIRDDDPSSSVWYVSLEAGVVRHDWNFRTVCTAELRVSPDAFFVRETVLAFEGDQLLCENSAEREIARCGY